MPQVFCSSLVPRLESFLRSSLTTKLEKILTFEFEKSRKKRYEKIKKRIENASNFTQWLLREMLITG